MLLQTPANVLLSPGTSPNRTSFGRLLIGLNLLMLLIPADGSAEQIPRPASLVIVTSFADDLYETFLDRFKGRHPEIPVKVLNKKTGAAISFIQEPIGQTADIFWASSPDAFEVLRAGGYLMPYRPRAPDIPQSIRGYPIHDPEGHYTGFAISGYGIMWNRPYLAARGLTPPATWKDLTDFRYFRHIGMSAPSRSGTTHMAVESILQSEGWRGGWATLLEIGGNLATVTARSFGVPDGVNSGRFGIGIVIDFFGLSSAATGFPVAFCYPPKTALVPANVAIIRGSPHPEAAARFIDFLVSVAGQNLLFEPHIRRMPVMPRIYEKAPPGYPNPFQENTIESIVFDSELSKRRYHLVNAMFDQMITYRHKALNRTWEMIHKAEQRLKAGTSAEIRAWINRARDLATQVPVTDRMADDAVFTAMFQRKIRGMPLSGKQLAIEQQWRQFTRNNLKLALELAEQADALLE